MAAVQKAPIDLYFWPTPNGLKITVFLEEAGLPYRIIPVNIGKGDQFKPEFLAISPNNRMPAIVDPEGPDGAPISGLARRSRARRHATRPSTGLREWHLRWPSRHRREHERLGAPDIRLRGRSRPRTGSGT